MTSTANWHRQLLWNLSGLAGENLATAYLKWLCDNPELRPKILRHLLGNAYDPKDGFVSVTTELPTEDKEHGNGRIDLVIETERMVVGVESKFYADFQTNQPVKYLKTLCDRVGVKGQCGKKVALVLLVPRNRRDLLAQDIKDAVQRQAKVLDASVAVTFCVWEELCDDLLESAPEVLMLKGYVDECCDPFVQLKRRFDVTNELDYPSEKGSAVGGPLRQSEFLVALRSFADAVPAANLLNKISHGTSWTCLYVSVQRGKDQATAMLGFVDPAFYGIPAQASAKARVFVICLPETFQVSSSQELPPGVKRVHRTVTHPTGIISHGKRDGSVWLVEDSELKLGDDSLRAAERWVQRLRWAFGSQEPNT